MAFLTNPLLLPFLVKIGEMKQKYKEYEKIPYSLFVAQMRPETSNFTGLIYRENNNLFGMRHPKQRQTKSLGEKNEHAYFANCLDSIEDFFLYLRARKIKYVNPDQYIKDIAKAYNAGVGQAHYIDTLTTIYKQESYYEIIVSPLVEFQLKKKQVK